MDTLLCAQCGRVILAHHGWMLSRRDHRDSAQVIFVHARACASHYMRRHRHEWVTLHIPREGGQ